jgi:hypothetical protein
VGEVGKTWGGFSGWVLRDEVVCSRYGKDGQFLRMRIG